MMRQTHINKEINVYWNIIYQTVFHFHKWESVIAFICGLRRFDFNHIYVLARLKCLKLIISTNN